MKKISGLLILLLGLSFAVMAQNDLQLSHQIYNRILFNPAATGQSGCYNITLLAREQWTGIKKAPETQILNINKYITPAKLGLGLSVISDKVGYENILNVKAAIAYHAWLSKRTVLSFGVGGGIISTTVEGSKLTYQEPGDPNATISNITHVYPDFDFGAEFNSGGLNLGVSSTHVVTSFKKSDLMKMPRHIYAYGKYAIKVTKGFEIIPAVSYSNINRVHLFDCNATFSFSDRVWAGASYRIEDSFVLMAGVKIINQLRIGYSYDFKTGPIKSAITKGTHEAMIQMKFGCPSAKPNQISPRFFN
ncbi:MAG: type IX secretion system membrane protein PorP/SprF [Bacteroidota bacterium]